MSLYSPSEVNLPIKAQALLLLQQSDSRFVVQKVLDVVFWNLLVQPHSLEESYRWLSNEEMIPADLYQRKDYYFDRRRLCYWFWDELCKLDYGSLQQRLANGFRSEHLIENILTELAGLPFLSALNTWFATCEAYLQVCNIDWYVDQNLGQLRKWKDGEEKEIPRYLAGLMVLIYS
jgi:hypothetical protein